MDRSNVYCNMFGPHIHNHCGLYITNPLIHLLSIDFFAHDHAIVVRCSFDAMFEFQIFGAYFPNDNHRDYIIDTI